MAPLGRREGLMEIGGGRETLQGQQMDKMERWMDGGWGAGPERRCSWFIPEIPGAVS